MGFEKKYCLHIPNAFEFCKRLYDFTFQKPKTDGLWNNPNTVRGSLAVIYIGLSNEFFNPELHIIKI